MRAVDAMEYAVLLAFIYSFFYGPIVGKEMVLYAAVPGFFLLSGASWVISGDSPAAKEYKNYALPVQATAMLIGIATLAYVWLL
jgi:hypothetical protein